MHKLFYNPPPGTPPFEWLHAGTTYVMYPPDKYWIRGKETYTVGMVPLSNPRFGASEKERYREFTREKDCWQEDVSKNELLAQGLAPPPRNYAWVSNGALSEAKKRKHAPLNSYLIKESDLVKKHENELAELESLQATEMEKAATALARLKAKQSVLLQDEQAAIDAAKARIDAKAREEIRRELLAEHEGRPVPRRGAPQANVDLPPSIKK